MTGVPYNPKCLLYRTESNTRPPAISSTSTRKEMLEKDEDNEKEQEKDVSLQKITADIGAVVADRKDTLKPYRSGTHNKGGLLTLTSSPSRWDGRAVILSSRSGRHRWSIPLKDKN
jgi:hypothetical protein